MNIAISGLGKAGKALVDYIAEKTGDTLVCAICRDDSPSAGMSIAQTKRLLPQQRR